jgi:hypothetical protein
MQRDPNGTALAPNVRVGSSSVMAGGQGFIERDHDPHRQYADGMNLYQYTRSNPTNFVDPYGLFSHSHDCNQQQLQAIRAAEAGSRNTASDALRVLRRQFDQPSVLARYPIMAKAQSRVILNKHANWHNATDSSLSATDAGYAGNNYGVECECECDEGTLAYVRPGLVAVGLDDDIHFCPDFFAANAATQREVFFHEMTHFFAGTNDRGLGIMAANPKQSWSRFADDAHWLDDLVNTAPFTVFDRFMSGSVGVFP